MACIGARYKCRKRTPLDESTSFDQQGLSDCMVGNPRSSSSLRTRRNACRQHVYSTTPRAPLEPDGPGPSTTAAKTTRDRQSRTVTTRSEKPSPVESRRSYLSRSPRHHLHLAGLQLRTWDRQPAPSLPATQKLPFSVLPQPYSHASDQPSSAARA